ncbi:unnamed protein product [Zymoseptoria tritici ST99CH_3D1]|nr:unnamed protein product [Zymoseptoria tritici ST99CH_3D1]
MSQLQHLRRGSRFFRYVLSPRSPKLKSSPRVSPIAPAPTTSEPIARLQAFPTLTVCHIEGRAPDWSESQRYIKLTRKTKSDSKTSKGKKTKDKKIDRNIDETIDKDIDTNTDNNVDHITFLFLRNGHNTRATWTFEFPEHPKDLLRSLCMFSEPRSNDVVHEMSAALRSYVWHHYCFNTTDRSSATSPHYVRYGFHGSQGPPLLSHVEQLESDVSPRSPKKWSYSHESIDALTLFRLVLRERQLTSLKAAYGIPNANGLVKFAEPADDIKRRCLEYRYVGPLTDRCNAIKPHTTDYETEVMFWFSRLDKKWSEDDT